MKKILLIAVLIVSCVFTGCGASQSTDKSSSDVQSYETTIRRAEPETTIKADVETTVEIETTVEVETTSEIETKAESNLKPEANTSEMVDYIALKAKEDAETATDEDIQNAVDWLKNNTTNYFSGNENMEKTMYYGELLEYKYKGTNNKYEEAGWQAFKTVKYVYRGYENITDDATLENLRELKELVSNL